jgi:hypothetical protein
MDINKAFEDFLDKKVNLNEGRVKRMKDAIRILPEFVKGTASYKDIYVGAAVQGSARQKTIIKPSTEDCAFDVDLMIAVKEKAGWTPKDYLANLAAEFRESGRYEDITDTNGKTRCVTINYEGDFHVDLVPVVVTAAGLFVCNKQTDKFEPTDGEGYAKWFEGQNAIANGHLVHVVRLLKYLRDYNEDFGTKSIILTTIAGLVVRPGGGYGTLPQAFATITTDMASILAKFEEPPSIPNPAMPGENFNRHWKADKPGFKLLKAALDKYSAIARSAVVSPTPVSEWKKLFGNSFGASSVSAAVPGLVSPTFARSSYSAPASFHPQRTYGTHD